MSAINRTADIAQNHKNMRRDFDIISPFMQCKNQWKILTPNNRNHYNAIFMTVDVENEIDNCGC